MHSPASWRTSRRRFLRLGAAIGAGGLFDASTALRVLAQTASGKDARMIVHSARPMDLETPVALLDDFITPIEAFYVRSHMNVPQADPASWRLAVDGEVANPAQFSLDDLRRLPRASVTMTLECAGNGRAFFTPPVAGIQWRRGAVGTARWSGVRLADLVRPAGARPAGRFVWAGGADRPLGTQPAFVRQVPMTKALHPDTIVAYAMNDRPIPVDHGSPARLIVPGWEGAYSVKWLDRLTVAVDEQPGFWVNTAYRYPRRLGAPGAAVDAADMAPLTGLVVKSLISRPLAGAVIAPGRLTIAGFAWAGERDIARVDVSSDGGVSWQPARLIGPVIRFAWRRFEHTVDASTPGARTLLSRATDDRGQTQPLVPAWNPAGYLWNGPDQVSIEVRAGAGTPVAGAAAPRPSPPLDADTMAAGQAVYERACRACHDSALVDAQRLSDAAWRRSVAKMVQWGARVETSEVDALAAYLASRWGVP